MRLDSLTDDSHVLIAEACTHAPLQEDIGKSKNSQYAAEKVWRTFTGDRG